MSSLHIFPGLLYFCCEFPVSFTLLKKVPKLDRGVQEFESVLLSLNLLVYFKHINLMVLPEISGGQRCIVHLLFPPCQ